MIRRRASEGVPGSYILESMRPAYKAASFITGASAVDHIARCVHLNGVLTSPGKGQNRKQKLIVRECLSERTLFKSIALAVSKDVRKAIEHSLKPIKNKIKHLVAELLADLDSESPDSSPERVSIHTEEFDRAHKGLQKAIARIHTQHLELTERIQVLSDNDLNQETRT
jgi:hypothetical protein